MAEINNLNEITENFDTIKTLLNSIRAQGILNTSDVDKLLTGINTKLEKINTEEDIDLIKVFLSELKQNLEERHGVLLSKFGAIESLFSNLLKNSSQTMKSSEIKELFDIVATNLSVFSREVVSQKETLSDIILRLDSMRSDDSQKTEIIKNISILKNDLERLINGFDSIVLNLNENFKSVVQKISAINPSEDINKFRAEISDIVNSSKTLLSAIQILDRKNETIEELLKGTATHDDLIATKQWISDLATKEHELTVSIDDLANKYYKIDNLAEKIDASVDIIAGLKALIPDTGERNATKIASRLDELEVLIKEVTTNTEYEEFKKVFETSLKELTDNSADLSNILKMSSTDIQKINDAINALDINVCFQSLSSAISKSEQNLRELVTIENDKIVQLVDVNTTRTLNEISTNADNLTEKIEQTQNLLAGLCEKSFNDVEYHISNLKAVVAQIDENNTSGNNAIFSNITDRLTLFENCLQTSLTKQENCIVNSSNSLVEKITSIKELSGILDYKMDSSIIEIGNAKKEFSDLKIAINDVLALDFVNNVKDLKVDLYAIKKDLSDALETSSGDLSDKITNDLFGKYELLISKLDNVETEIKQAQANSLNGLKGILDNISSSIVDILSYVSTFKEADTVSIDNKLESISKNICDYNLNFIDNVRDIVDVIRVQVENNINSITENADTKYSTLTELFNSNQEIIRKALQNSYNKLTELQKTLDTNNDIFNDDITNILSTADSLRSDFESKLSALKASLIEKVSDIQQELVCNNADKMSEIKLTSESLYTKTVQNSMAISNELKGEVAQIVGSLKLNFEELAEILSGTSHKIENLNSDTVSFIKNDFSEKLNVTFDNVELKIDEFSNQVDQKTNEIVSGYKQLEASVEELSGSTTAALSSTLAKILENFVSLKAVMASFNDKTAANVKANVDEISNQIQELSNKLDAVDSNIDEDLSRQISLLESGFESINNCIISVFENNISKTEDRLIDEINNFEGLLDKNYSTLESNISEGLNSIKASLNQNIDNSVGSLKQSFGTSVDNLEQTIANNLTKLDSNVENNINQIESKLDNKLNDITSSVDNVVQTIDANVINSLSNLENTLEKNTGSLAEDLNGGLNSIESNLTNVVIENLNDYKEKIEVSLDNIIHKNNEQNNFINSKVCEMNNALQNTLEQQNSDFINRLKEITENLQTILGEYVELTNEDYKTLYEKLQLFKQDICNNNAQIADNFKAQLDDIVKYIDSGLEIQAQDITNNFNDMSKEIRNLSTSVISLNAETKEVVSNQINSGINAQTQDLKNNFEELTKDVLNLSTSVISQNTETKEALSNQINSGINAQTQELKNNFEELSKDVFNLSTSVIDLNSETKEALSNQINSEINNQTQELKNNFEELSKDITNISASVAISNTELDNTLSNKLDLSKQAVINNIKAELSIINEKALNMQQSLFSKTENSIENSVNSMLAAFSDISAGELQVMEEFTNNIVNDIKATNENLQAYKDLLIKVIKDELVLLSGNIEKETDIIIKDLIEQANLIKDVQKDEFTKMTTQIGDIVEEQIYSQLNDLKTYLDIKTDSSVLNSKLDSLSTELNRSVEDILAISNKLLESSVFDNALSEIKATNEILISSMSENLNNKLQTFIKNNINNNIDEKFLLFDKKFTDMIIEKYEEIKLFSSQHNQYLSNLETAVESIIPQFDVCKREINAGIVAIVNGVNENIDTLKLSFDDLKAQILNKSFDEAFQASINTQISTLESLINRQFNYLEDISDLCCSNLPEVTEMNMILKCNIMESIKDFAEKLDSKEAIIQKEINSLKTDVITQFLNIFNQISFVAEQEEILDFIQDKHSELITILSHIVTTSDEIENVKDNVAIIDNKVDTLKEDIDLINEKITAILSSEGDIDYVYSLQDLESDIVNLRLALDEIKNGSNSKEFEKLVNSTNDIYTLITSIKEDLPNLNTEEFRKDFESLSEDIVSISTRTNKLILASDESYKTLQENLQDFKLVINDLDERTRNFAQEVGLDRIDNKLGALNTMIQNGSKTNQVFNQVFEYLAEWVDSAGAQINAISNKVETLDDIGQIKVMLEDLKAENEDTSESTEMIEALANIFEKQAKKISSLESKLDRIIVENTINNKNNKVDLSPMEETLNRFLVAIDSKMFSQQEKIDSLESKLEAAVSMLDSKDTAQLTKKVGGMDRQIAKLNKSIEKIASHVVEK